jgi:hypothetical protein
MPVVGGRGTTRPARDRIGQSPLESAFASQTRFAADRRIPVVLGARDLTNNALPLVTFVDWEHRDGMPSVVDEMQQFITTLDSLGVAMLVLRSPRLTRVEWEDAVAKVQDAHDGFLQDRDTGDDGVDACRRSLEALVERVRELDVHIGELQSLRVSAITRNPAVIVQWNNFQPWDHFVDDVEGPIDEILDLHGDLDAQSKDKEER